MQLFFESAGARPAPGAMSKCKVCGGGGPVQGKQNFDTGGVVPMCTRGAWVLSVVKGHGCARSVQNRPKGMVDVRSSLITCL